MDDFKIGDRVEIIDIDDISFIEFEYWMEILE